MGHLSTAVLVQHLHPGAGPGPAASHRVAASVTVYLAVTVAGLLAAPLLTGVAGRLRLRTWTIGLLGAALVVSTGLAVRLHAPWPELGHGVALVAFVAHVIAAAIWLGGVLHLAFFVAPDRRLGVLQPGIRHFSRYAVGSGAALAGTGVALYAAHHLAVSDLTSTGFGALITGKAVLLLVGATLGLVHSGALSPSALRRRPALLRAEAATLGAALGLGSALGAVAPPLPATQLLGGGLATVATDAAPTNLFALSTTRDRGLVELVGDESAAVHDRLSGRTFQLQPGQLAGIALAGGIARLTVTNGQRPVRADVPAAAAVPVPASDVDANDHSEWTAYQLGHALAVSSHVLASATPCAGPGPFDEGRAMGQLLRATGIQRLVALVDAADRSRALVSGVRAAGVAVSRHTYGNALVLVATSPAHAPAVLRRLARKREPAQALYLAPWLFDGGLLSMSSSSRLPPMAIASTTNPMSPLADRFRIALGARAPGVQPSVAALRGYLTAVDPSAATGPMRLYAASPVGFLPGVVDTGHAHDGQGWFANGTLVPVSTAANARHAACVAVSA